MKPVFKCEYCTFTGTEEEVKEHELQCTENYNKKNCLTCVHRDGLEYTEGGWTYKCKVGIDIPAQHIYEYCYKYERKEKPKSKFDFNYPISFGWI